MGEPGDPREYRTSEVASILGVPTDNLRKWKARGLLIRAPSGVSGQGRGVECLWSEAAIEEARQVRDSRKARQGRRAAPPSTAGGPGAGMAEEG